MVFAGLRWFRGRFLGDFFSVATSTAVHLLTVYNVQKLVLNPEYVKNIEIITESHEHV